MRFSRALWVFSSLLVFSAPGLTADKGPGNMNAITANRLYAHLQLVSSDEMEGRDTPSRGLNTTAKYIASELMQWGVKPMGDDGTYFQRVPLLNPTVNPTGTTTNLAGADLKYGDDYYAAAVPGSAEGQVVFMGSAWENTGAPDDPYTKIDVKDKIILSVQGAPDGVSRADIRSGKVLTPQGAAAKYGAKGLIFIYAGDGSDWDNTVKLSLTGSALRPASTATTPIPPYVIVKPQALTGLLQGESLSPADLEKHFTDKLFGAPFALQASKTAKLSIATDDNTINTQNVVGEVEGTDSMLRNEFVAVGAHYDHLGMKKSGTGDLIFNGADDDGSGTVSILEIAHAFAEGPKPKRSILFVWHCGEEKGLWDSAYFTGHPTVPITSIVAQLNIDMIGRSKKPGDTNPLNKVLTGPDAIYLVGTTRMSSELGAEAKDVNKRLYNLAYDFTYDDLNNSERIFFRSDHYNYASHGIPILFWFDGVHEDYHRVSDEIQKIDFQKMEKVARTVYATAWDVANRKIRPKVDLPLPAGTAR